jgi:hypothetical protein
MVELLTKSETVEKFENISMVSLRAGQARQTQKTALADCYVLKAKKLSLWCNLKTYPTFFYFDQFCMTIICKMIEN